MPGPEIAGRIDAVGADVTLWKPGQRVGVGWHGGHCFVCDACRRGDFMLRQNEKITVSISLVDMPNTWLRRRRRSPPCRTICLQPGLPPCSVLESACLTRCAMRACAREKLVAVQGIAGLGHLGIQYARQMGFRTIAIGRGKDKEPLARKLGTHECVDTGAVAPAEALQKLAGAPHPGHCPRFKIHFSVARWPGRQREVADRGSRF